MSKVLTCAVMFNGNAASTVALANAQKLGHKVYAVTVDLGGEFIMLNQTAVITAKLGIPQIVVSNNIQGHLLTNKKAIDIIRFIECFNSAVKLGCNTIVWCGLQTRVNYQLLLDQSKEVGQDIELVMPFKNDTQSLVYCSAHKNNVVDLIRAEAVECLHGDRYTPQEWGVGCGECEHCRRAKQGWNTYQLWKNGGENE